MEESSASTGQEISSTLTKNNEDSANDHLECRDTKDVSEHHSSKQMRKYNNVTFPCGFTPSQCSLLASRQSSVNYLFFLTNENGEFLANQKPSCEPVKSTIKIKKRKKKKKNQTGRSTKEITGSEPVLPVFSKNKTRLSPLKEAETTTCSTGLQTGFARRTQWKTKEDVARTLSAHARQLSKIQSQETIEELRRVERALQATRNIKHSSTSDNAPLQLFKFKKN